MSTALDLFFSSERPFALALNLIILILTLTAVLRAVFVMLVIMRKERQLLEKVRRVPPTVEGIAAVVQGSKTQVESRVQDLLAFHRGKHKVDAASLTGLTTAAFRTQLAYADGIGRSLVVLGLLGTLWGLGSAVTHLAGTISPSSMNANALTTSILKTLGGLQTAFGTTLAGLIGALLVGLTVGIARGRQAAVLREIERIMSTTLVPLFDTSEGTSLSDAAKALEEIKLSVGEDMRSIISKLGAEGAELREALEKNFNELEDAFQHRAEQLVQATGKALESTLSIIGKRAEGEPTLAEYVRTIQSSVDGLQNSVRSASSLIPELELRMTQAIDRQRTGLEEVFSRHERTMEPLLERQSDATEVLTQLAKQNVESSGTLGDALDRFAERLDSARTRWADLDEKVVEIGVSCQQGIQNGLRAVVDQLAEVRKGDSDERERIARHLATFETELRQHLERLLDERSRVLAQMSELVAVTREAVQSAILQVGERLGDREHAQSRELNHAVENLARELRGMVGPAHPPPALGADGVRPGRVRLAWARVAPVAAGTSLPSAPEQGD
jgi:hypothetical protein